MKKSSSDPKPKSGDELVEKKKEVKKRVKKTDKEVLVKPVKESIEKVEKSPKAVKPIEKAKAKPIKPKKVASDKLEPVKKSEPTPTPDTNVKPKIEPKKTLSLLPNYLDDPLIQKPNMRLMEQKVSESYQ